MRKYLFKISPEERGLIKVMSVSTEKQFLVFEENENGQKAIKKLTIEKGKNNEKNKGVLAEENI